MYQDRYRQLYHTLLTSTWPHQLMRHADNRRALTSTLDDLSFYQSTSEIAREKVVRSLGGHHTVCQAVHMPSGKRSRSWSGLYLLRQLLPPYEPILLLHFLQLMTANQISSHGIVAASVLWPRQVGIACRFMNGRLKMHLAELHRSAPFYSDLHL